MQYVRYRPGGHNLTVGRTAKLLSLFSHLLAWYGINEFSFSMTNYLVAVLDDRKQTEEAYKALEREALPVEQVSILGEGYDSADDFGLIHPDREAEKSSERLATWLLPFGFAAGFAFNVLTDIQIVSWLNAFSNHVIGGLFGAASGLLGAYTVGRLSGWTVGSGDAIAYRNRLNAGKYLIIARGGAGALRRATRTLRQFEPENLQGYEEQAGA